VYIGQTEYQFRHLQKKQSGYGSYCQEEEKPSI
jgi:hypothetical protein